MFKKRKRDRGYTTIDNGLILNTKLSYKAKGILLYLMSRPEDWEVYQTDIVNRSKESRTAVESGLNELETEGYLIKIRHRTSKGQMATFWLYDDIPMDKNDNEIQEQLSNLDPIVKKEKTTVENPQWETHSGKPTVENQQLVIKEEGTKEQPKKKPSMKDNSSSSKEEEYEEEEIKAEENVIKYLKLVLGYDQDKSKAIVQKLKSEKIMKVTPEELKHQHDHMVEKIKNENTVFGEWHTYFVNGIKRNQDSFSIMREIMMLEQMKENRKVVPFYNWLEE